LSALFFRVLLEYHVLIEYFFSFVSVSASGPFPVSPTVPFPYSQQVLTSYFFSFFLVVQFSMTTYLRLLLYALLAPSHTLARFNLPPLSATALLLYHTPPSPVNTFFLPFFIFVTCV